jgi:outer membrane lipoprotein SlyB
MGQAQRTAPGRWQESKADMKTKTVALLLTLALGANAGLAQAGCLKGAAVGAVGGHLAHHHALAGAAVGCVVGHHLSKKKEREQAAQQQAQAQQAQAQQPQDQSAHKPPAQSK